jgi:hypothetical protein
MLCSLELGCSRCKMDLSDITPRASSDAFVCHVSERHKTDFRILITEVYPRLLTCWILQRGMLARLAAQIDAGQMAAVGLGVGGEAAIVIDDNCTVSMVLEHRWLHNCHSKLLTHEPRLCEWGLK